MNKIKNYMIAIYKDNVLLTAYVVVRLLSAYLFVRYSIFVNPEIKLGVMGTLINVILSGSFASFVIINCLILFEKEDKAEEAEEAEEDSVRLLICMPLLCIIVNIVKLVKYGLYPTKLITKRLDSFRELKIIPAHIEDKQFLVWLVTESKYWKTIGHNYVHDRNFYNVLKTTKSLQVAEKENICIEYSRYLEYVQTKANIDSEVIELQIKDLSNNYRDS